MHTAWEVDWALRRPLVSDDKLPSRPPKPQERYFIADMAFMKAGDMAKVFSEFKVTAVGQFILVDRGEPAGPAEGYSFEEREPTPLEWYFVDGVDPVRTVRPDPWWTWELRNAFGQLPNPLPAEPPATLEQIRVAHNAAVFAEETDRAAELEKQLLAQLETATATFSDGTRFLGERYRKGVAPVLDLYFLAKAAAPADDIQFDVKSIIERAPLFSVVEADDKVKPLGMPLVIPPRLWRPGYIYGEHTEIRHRPGREVYTGAFTGGTDKTRPRLEDDGDLVLMTLR
jgi:hypothetical protein